jgi:hypothetical protein
MRHCSRHPHPRPLPARGRGDYSASLTHALWPNETFLRAIDATNPLTRDNIASLETMRLLPPSPLRGPRRAKLALEVGGGGRLASALNQDARRGRA